MSEGPRIEDIRRALAEAADAGLRAEGCPETSRIWEAQAGELSVFETRAVVEHTTLCPACAETWRVAHGLSGAAEPGARRERNWLGPVTAAAAAILVAAGLWLVVPPGVEQPAPVFREGRMTPIRSMVDAGRPQSRQAFHLSWSPVSQGAVYVVRVSTESFEPVFTSQALDRTECVVPPQALRDLAPRTRLLWQVEAVRLDGRRIQSDTFFALLE
jgi:hypothetical protein